MSAQPCGGGSDGQREGQPHRAGDLRIDHRSAKNREPRGAKTLAACVNIVLGPVQSIYRWKGKVQSEREVLMVIKTTEKRLAELEKEVAHWHSYDVPEFVVISVAGGSRDYLDWLEDSLRPG
jgi:periplasmic divalent cation tolerance protein